MTKWRPWRIGLYGAFMGGAANAVTVMVIEPSKFNFASGLTALWQFALISGIISACLYLKQNPLPVDDEADDETSSDSEAPKQP